MDYKDELARLEEKPVSSESLYEGVILHVSKDAVTLPNGDISAREYIRHVGAVGVIPVNDKNEAVIERQFRYPFHGVITEIPAGKLDGKAENHLDAAKRELQEETGITADSWEFLGDYYPTPAYTDEVISLYLARNLTHGKQKLDDDEFLDYKFVPLADLVEQVMNGEITDGKTQVAVLKAAKLLNI